MVLKIVLGAVCFGRMEGGGGNFTTGGSQGTGGAPNKKGGGGINFQVGHGCVLSFRKKNLRGVEILPRPTHAGGLWSPKDVYS